MGTRKRIRRDPEEAKLLILQTAEKIMLKEGYAAVTVRRVARDAGVSSTLLFYYYPTADDLLLALYRHTSEISLQLLQKTLSAEDPLLALWAYHTDASRTAIGIEFLALANHRKAIGAEIAKHAEKIRQIQTIALRASLGAATEEYGFSAECLALLLTSISRNIVFESGVGLSSGHDEARALVMRSLEQLRGNRA